ncbi:MAG: ABC transporter permease subunit [Ancalomicrobiaceae bacterium]|nr:ABC transporter permease subunit [Ancalomicrobiaceae bacterium]
MQMETIPGLARRALPSYWDLAAFIIVVAVLVGIVSGSNGVAVPLPRPEAPIVDLDYWNLPYYALRTTLRMFAALAASLVFTFVYASLCAKSRRAEMVLIPILDILQSVPILGFLSFTVTFFLGLFPGRVLGAECAAVFAIFTSQAWNMAFSFYQSLRTVPKDLDEVSRSFQLTGWQKFWQLEAPFAVPGLVYNMMISMSGGWFFVVASEAITVGDVSIKLPGIGSYLALAIDGKRLDAVFAAILTMLVVILAYDQILFRPIVAWAAKFRVELTASSNDPTSWVLTVFKRSKWLQALLTPLGWSLKKIRFARLRLPAFGKMALTPPRLVAIGIDWGWYLLITVAVGFAGWKITEYVSATLGWHDALEAMGLTLVTMVRVIVLIALASLVWVPIGVWIGLRPGIAEYVQPIAQFLAAFPVNVLFPFVVAGIVFFHLDPDIWLSFLIVFGTQWYILFNVIAGASAFPNDLKEVAANFHVRGWLWWKHVMLPGIFPYYFTGALTASGGSWNAAIVAEYVKWGDDKVTAHGIGAFIARATEAGDFPRIVLGVAMMSIFVTLLNRFGWRRLFAMAERRLRLD